MPCSAFRQRIKSQEVKNIILAGPQTGSRAMSFVVTEHIAAISPYSKFQTQPTRPPGLDVKGAVYLFRHGIIHVNGHDFHTGIVPFLDKLKRLKKSGKEYTRGELAFLQDYSCQVQERDIGRISEQGIRQCHKMGKTLSKRYADTLLAGNPLRGLDIWTDSAARCQESAQAFGQGFEEAWSTLASCSSPQSRVQKIDAGEGTRSCENLCWHKQFEEIDQSAGQTAADEFKSQYTVPIIDRLAEYAIGDFKLTPHDIYAMQLICCYDLVLEDKSPFSKLFTSEDWLGFEYTRDIKYYHSEGYGMPRPGVYALPWLERTIELLQELLAKRSGENLPLWTGFTHREEVLYLVIALGLYHDGSRPPSTTHMDIERKWNVGKIAPYLGHVGLEVCLTKDHQRRLRIIVNGEVVLAFKGKIYADSNWTYALDDVQRYLQQSGVQLGREEIGKLTFLK